MSCVWRGVINALKKDYQTCVDPVLKYKILNLSLKDLISLIRLNNKPTPLVMWNNNKITLQQQKENFDHIKFLREDELYNGYYCSTCDPLFFLLSELFKINIIHNYNGNRMKYVYTDDPRKTYIFSSDVGHFWFERIIK